MKQKPLNLDLQFFADDGTEVSTTTTETKSYSQEELDNVVNAQKSKYDKLKETYDKLSSEHASLKKKVNETLSEEQKKKEADELKDKEFQELQDKVLNYELKEKLLVDNVFTSDEASKIIANKNDFIALSDTIKEIFKSKLETAKKEWEVELMKKDTTPKGTSNTSGDDNLSLGAKMAKSLSKGVKEESVEWGLDKRTN